MLFRDVPESQFLTKNSRFVYSEDDEHLKYIRHMNLLRNRPRIFKNVYGVDPPDKPIGADLYDTMYYRYTDDIYDSFLWMGQFPDDRSWMPDAYINYHDYDPHRYPLVNNKVNFKTCWTKPISYYDEYANRVSIVNETHQSYVNQVPPPADWSQNTYTYVQARNTSTIQTYVATYQLDPGGTGGHFFFPVNDSTSYELRFKVRLHNLINEENIEYYPWSVYLISTTKPGHPGEINVPIKHHATYVNGISINFNDNSRMGTLSNSIIKGHTPYDGIGLQKYMGLQEHYDHPTPDESIRNDTNVDSIFWYLMPATVTPPLVLGFNSHERFENDSITLWRNWGLRWAALPRWEVLSIKDALSMNEEDLSKTNAYNLYESYFVRFGFDNDWHEFVVPLNNLDDYRNHQFITHLTPSISILLSGLRPTTANDSYVEIKDFEILSVPIRYKESKKYTQIDHIYLNKNGVWLPDDFTKESEFANFSRIRSSGQKIAECEFQGVQSEVYAPPLVDSASITTNYNDGTKIMDFKINGVSHPVYHPIKTISDAKIIEPTSISPTPFEFNIMENGVIKIKHNRKRCGIRRDSDGVLYYKFDNFDNTRSFGLANLNSTYQANISNNDDRGGYWICNAEVDICTDVGYTPDSDDEYLSFAVSGGSGTFFNNANFPLEKRIPLSIFGGQPMNHYKINIPFICYGNTSTHYFAINVIFKGKLKSGATLTTSENLTVTLKARRFLES